MKRANCNSVWQGVALLFILFYFGFCTESKAQTTNTYNAGDTLGVQLKASWQSDKVLLRWAPLNYTSWRYAHEFGFTLQRFTLARDGNLLSEGEIEAFKREYPIVPISRQAMETYLEQHPDDNNWGIAFASYYAPTFEATSGGTQDTKNGALTAYNIAKERDNRFGFCLLSADQNFDLAQAIGLGFTNDQEFAPNERYLYVLKFGGNPDTLQLISKDVLLEVADDPNAAAAGITDTPTPLKPEAKAGDKSAFLTWDVATMADKYVSYAIQRAGSNGVFTTLNSYPIINTSDTEPNIYHYADVLPQNNVWYSYRIVGHSPFGVESSPSDSVRVKGRPKQLEHTPYILAADLINTTGFDIKWEFPDSINAKINGFEVWRSETHDGTPILLTSSPLIATTRSKVDASPLLTNYYTVVALDKNGYRLTSLPKFAQLKDETPPAKPDSLDGTVDKMGSARLWWAANSENDLQGYRVFSCDQPDGEYAEITGYWIKENEFRFTLNPRTLHEVQYFKVAALDIRENQSELSEWFPLHLVDVIPPVPPVIRNIEALTTGVQIDFEPSSSIDVVTHEIKRKQVSETTWKTIKTLPKQQYPVKAYLDNTAENLEDYQYQIVAIDDAGLTAVTPIRKIQALGSGVRPSVQGLEVILDVFPFQHNGTSPAPIKPGRFKVAKLTWKYDAKHRNVEQFWIYRTIIDAESGQDVTVLWKTVSPDNALFGQQDVVVEGGTGATSTKKQNTFMVEDDDVHLIAEQIPQNIRYQVMVHFDDGTVSELTPSVHPQ